jgi:hypothetical protein
MPRPSVERERDPMAHDLPFVPAAGLQQGHPGAVPLLAHSGAGLRRAGSQDRKASRRLRARRPVASRSPSAPQTRRRAPARIPRRAAHRHRRCKGEATYASLSSIARAITGTAWNGPRFFGLRIDKRTTVSPDAADASPGTPNGRQFAWNSGTRPRQAAQHLSDKSAAVMSSLHGGERRS